MKSNLLMHLWFQILVGTHRLSWINYKKSSILSSKIQLLYFRRLDVNPHNILTFDTYMLSISSKFFWIMKILSSLVLIGQSILHVKVPMFLEMKNEHTLLIYSANYTSLNWLCLVIPLVNDMIWFVSHMCS